MSALLDTSVVIALKDLPLELPSSTAISAITIAEMAAGLRTDPTGTRATYLRNVLSIYDPIPFDTDVAEMYGQVVTAVRHHSRKERGRHLDLMIAATAMRHSLPLYTLNAEDLKGLHDLVQVVDLST